jgi:hypothetical protein
MAERSAYDARLAAVEKKVNDLHRALLEPGADGDPPMIQRISAVVKFAEGGEWAVKYGMRAIAVISGATAAIWAMRHDLAELIHWLLKRG